MYHRILVATDGTHLSDKAVGSAIGLAASLKAGLVVLYVAPRYPMSYFEGGATISTEDVARTEKQWFDKGQAVVDRVKLSAQSAGIEVKAVVAQSDFVAETILSATRKNECDLVVMASHGRKGLERLLLGSETQHVLTRSAIPVLVLR